MSNNFHLKFSKMSMDYGTGINASMSMSMSIKMVIRTKLSKFHLKVCQDKGV